MRLYICAQKDNVAYVFVPYISASSTDITGILDVLSNPLYSYKTKVSKNHYKGSHIFM